MSGEITSATPMEPGRPYGSAPDERGSLGTLSWPRAAKVAGLAGAVAALAAASIAASHAVHVVGPPVVKVHPTSVVVPSQGPPTP